MNKFSNLKYLSVYEYTVYVNPGLKVAFCKLKFSLCDEQRGREFCLHRKHCFIDCTGLDWSGLDQVGVGHQMKVGVERVRSEFGRGGGVGEGGGYRLGVGWVRVGCSHH